MSKSTAVNFSGKALIGATLLLAAIAPAGVAGPNDYFAPGAAGSFPDDTPNGSVVGGPSKSSTTSNSPLPSMPGSVGSPSSSDSAQAAPAPSATSGTLPPSGQDNTADEKRMQRKYKANLSHMKDLIAKGNQMMKSAPNQNDSKYKKGKILKEMGEKHLADMQANNPFNLDPLDDKKKDSK
jgi:hypothetical protein